MRPYFGRAEMPERSLPDDPRPSTQIKPSLTRPSSPDDKPMSPIFPHQRARESVADLFGQFGHPVAPTRRYAQVMSELATVARPAGFIAKMSRRVAVALTISIGVGLLLIHGWKSSPSS